MGEPAREAREEAAEREVTGRDDCCLRAVERGRTVQAALERALTVQVPPERLLATAIDGRTLSARTTRSKRMRPTTGRGRSVPTGPAANAGFPWERAPESKKGGQHR
jgi:hypothetical protein